MWSWVLTICMGGGRAHLYLPMHVAAISTPCTRWLTTLRIVRGSALNSVLSLVSQSLSLSFSIDSDSHSAK